MGLSSDLLSQFVKITNDKKEDNKETTAFGTVVKVSETEKYVKLDGSSINTPIPFTTNADDGDRVTVLIKNHTAVVTGNITKPSATNSDVNDVNAKVSIFENVVANKVDTEDFNAHTARIEDLEADNVVIKETLVASGIDVDKIEANYAVINDRLKAHDASIETLEADNVTINDSLDAAIANISTLQTDNTTVRNQLIAAQADIDSLETNKLDADTASITYATIEKLESEYATTNASIDELKANKLSASDIEGKFANIDFSNISKATMEYFYSNSGLIENVVVGDGTITGNLVGVTITGDLIEGNTIKAEKLVIKGTDGLYYKLNTDGVTTESEQTEYNSLDGSVITVKSITATKISVDDLVAFDATIGGFNISENSLYSGVKSSVDNTTRGIYLDSEGQMAIGDIGSFIKYYRDTDGTYKLSIVADTIELRARSSEEAITLADLSEETKVNSEDLTSYISSTNVELANLQQQIDGAIATWFYEYVPTNDNVPASEWTSTELKNNHLGDLFYDTLTGYCYRWQVQNNVYSWNRITDVDVTKALSDAHAAQDTADSKRRVFVITPTPPYDVGDLWVQGSSGDIMRCQTAKTSEQSYTLSDWVKASKYTDDTKANAVENSVNALTTRVSTAETKISENSEAIKLTATKAEVASSLNGYYTKEQSDSNLTLKADSIVANVASTYATKTSLEQTNANVSKLQKGIDILSEGKGIAFNKPAELENVADIGYQTRLAGGLLYPVLEPETDLDDIRTPNLYVGANVSDYNYVNCPLTSGTFTLEVISSGEVGQVLQRLTRCHKTYPVVYERFYYASSWAPWTGGWIYPTLNSKFNMYGTSTSDNQTRYRKDGRLVEVRGIVTPASDIAGSTTIYPIFTLPDGYRPTSPIYVLCQGSGNCSWLLRINTDGEVGFSRYRNGDTTTTASAGTWLPFQATFLTY